MVQASDADEELGADQGVDMAGVDEQDAPGEDEDLDHDAGEATVEPEPVQTLSAAGLGLGLSYDIQYPCVLSPASKQRTRRKKNNR